MQRTPRELDEDLFGAESDLVSGGLLGLRRDREGRQRHVESERA